MTGILRRFITCQLLIVCFLLLRRFPWTKVRVLTLILRIRVRNRIIRANTNMISILVKRVRPLARRFSHALRTIARTNSLRINMFLRNLTRSNRKINMIRRRYLEAMNFSILTSIRRWQGASRNPRGTKCAANITRVSIRTMLFKSFGIIPPCVRVSIGCNTRRTINPFRNFSAVDNFNRHTNKAFRNLFSAWTRIVSVIRIIFISIRRDSFTVIGDERNGRIARATNNRLRATNTSRDGFGRD